MEFSLLHICTILSIAIMACNAALPGEVYWNSKLPNTPMPNAVKDLLQPDEWTEDKSTSVSVGKGGVNVNTRKGNGGTSVNVGHKGVGVTTGKPRGGTNVNVGRKGGVSVSAGKPGKRTNVGVGKGGVTVRSGHKGKPVYVGVKPGPDPFVYKYAASETQLHDNPNVAIFFLQTELHQGKKMNLNFAKTPNEATFLPRRVADAIPFSSSKVADVLDQFAVDPDSDAAEAMKKTVKECEQPGIAGEEKYCATSLESMVDYATSKLGKNVEPIATESGGMDMQKLQEYTISGVENRASEKAAVACHRQKYVYAVFYCHKTRATVPYTVSLQGVDGSKAKAVAVCHKDTSAWNPKHLAFQLLNVKPGTVPVCHFLPEDHIVWVSK